VVAVAKRVEVVEVAFGCRRGLSIFFNFFNPLNPSAFG